MKAKIINLIGHPLSGLRTLVIELENKEIRLINGDWRPMMNLIEDLNLKIGSKIEVNY